MSIQHFDPSPNKSVPILELLHVSIRPAITYNTTVLVVTNSPCKLRIGFPIPIVHKYTIFCDLCGLALQHRPEGGTSPSVNSGHYREGQGRSGGGIGDEHYI